MRTPQGRFTRRLGRNIAQPFRDTFFAATGDAMNVTLLKALVALVPVCLLFSGSLVLFFRGKTVFALLQLLGASCLVMVVLTHVFEALLVFPWMHWGLEHSIGHYLDFWSAVLGFTLFPTGYLLDVLAKGQA